MTLVRTGSAAPPADIYDAACRDASLQPFAATSPGLRADPADPPDLHNYPFGEATAIACWRGGFAL